MKHVTACFVAGMAGALVTLWFVTASPSGFSTASAQNAQTVQTVPQDGQFSPLPRIPRSRSTNDDRDAGLAGAGTGAVGHLPRSTADGRSIFEPPVYDEDGLTPDEAAAAYVYETNNQSVVNIATRLAGGRFMFRNNPTEDAGSGFLIDFDGHIMTNFHVIEDAERILVTLFNGESYEAMPVGGDPINDIAVIRVEAPRDVLFPVSIADSSRLKVGMKVFAIGNPFALERTMTTGIISSLNRTLPVTQARSIKSVIQIDAAINPGNSGGPLLDSHGRLIGMNTAIASRTGQNSGIGFAIPSNLISRVIPELLEHGRVIRPDIGIIQVLRTEEGLRVLKMDPQGPAAKAGLRGPSIQRRKSGFMVFEYEDRSTADLIVGVNGQKTLEVDEFLSVIESHRPGDTVTVIIIRDGKSMQIPVTLTE